MKNAILKNKLLYKIVTIYIKYTPSIVALIQILNTYLNYAGITMPILGFTFGSSLIFLILIYLLSYLFQYCYLYRIPVFYTLILNVLVLFRSVGMLTIDILSFYRLLMIITGIFISIFVFFIYKNRNNPKVEGIKNFCERYCNY